MMMGRSPLDFADLMIRAMAARLAALLRLNPAQRRSIQRCTSSCLRAAESGARPL